MSDTAIPLPLAGARVLNLMNVLVGPFCTYLLVLMGAKVVKIEQQAAATWPTASVRTPRRPRAAWPGPSWR